MEVVKVCKKHGELFDIDVIKEGPEDSIYFRCKRCKLENSIKRGGTCKTHGVLEKQNIRTDGRCALCHRVTAGKSRNENRPKFNERMRVDRIENPDKWIEIRKREYRQSIENHGRESRITKEIIRMHGLTLDAYEKMFESQNHRCAICNEAETRAGRTKGTVTRLCVDHCHKTNTVRGLLCHACNTAIGKFKDNVDLMEKAIRYLRR